MSHFETIFLIKQGGKMILLQAGYTQVGFEDQYIDINDSYVKKESFFVSESPIMKVVQERIEQLSKSSKPVLILGAGGSGKSTVAREIFNKSQFKKSQQFISINCNGLSENIIKRKLFGGVGDLGFLSCGSKNTVFIKGVDSWTFNLQNSFMQYMLNSKNKKNLPRLIFSAKENLSQKVKEGHFSHQIFELISQNLLILPSLSERKEDIPFLIALFSKKYKFQSHITENALNVLQSYFWKGNVTELKNICLQLSILFPEKEFVTEQDLHQVIDIKGQKSNVEEIKYDPNLTLENVINIYIQLSLNHFQSKKKSATALGISVKTIYNKIKSGSVSCP